ncbi:MAG: hypothetical protein J5863_01135 [Desulfovibrio sp.]|nr:hypothetical protein [Desulfovibrio sp.]
MQRDGMLAVLRHGFAYRNIPFRVCCFQPESSLNEEAARHYAQNVCQCMRQWHYSPNNGNSVDMMLAVNGIPVVAVELKNQLRRQIVDNAKKQWMFDRDPVEIPFKLNSRVLVFFAVDLYGVCMTTRLNKAKTLFLPFTQGRSGAGRDGGAGNPQSKDGAYVTAYFWQDVLQKVSLLDVVQKFMNLEVCEEKVSRPTCGREPRLPRSSSSRVSTRWTSCASSSRMSAGVAPDLPAGMACVLPAVFGSSRHGHGLTHRLSPAALLPASEPRWQASGQTVAGGRHDIASDNINLSRYSSIKIFK